MKCRTCKQKFEPQKRGRRPRFCSAACRQKDYRKRYAAVGTKRWIRQVVRNDIATMEDRNARAAGAIKILNDLGFHVALTRGAAQVQTEKKAHLKLVTDNPSNHDELDQESKT